MQSIIQFAVSRKTTILMVIAALLLLGSVSWSRIPVDLLPDITFPAAAVSVNWVGAGPEEVEASVTRILEGSLGTITGIKDVQSISSMDNALIILLFNWGTDMDMAAIEIREKLDMVASLLPDDTSAPTMFKFDPSMLPVMNIALASDSLDLVELNRLGDEVS
ncbi:MAG TPA: multidrug ABC transporter, partial [Firmicutes bacterium]|nr:multidrug ABC transporter [Bacillota bacterium]